MRRAGSSVAALGALFSDLPSLQRWFELQVENPQRRAVWIDVLLKLGAALLAAIALQAVAFMAVRRSMAKLAPRGTGSDRLGPVWLGLVFMLLRVLVALVDVPSQAYGRREEALGIHQALAGAVDAYARARLAGHPVIGLLVGKAMSGAFLAHGYQAQRLIALDDSGVMVHAMGKAAAARITLRSVEELEALAAKVPPMAYDLENYASLGLLWERVAVADAEQPGDADIDRVRECLVRAVADIGASTDLAGRLGQKISE